MWLVTDEFGPQSPSTYTHTRRFIYKHGLRRLGVEQVQQKATLNFALSGIADRDLGDDVLEVFAAVNASNAYCKHFRRFFCTIKARGNSASILRNTNFCNYTSTVFKQR